MSFYVTLYILEIQQLPNVILCDIMYFRDIKINLGC